MCVRTVDLPFTRYVLIRRKCDKLKVNNLTMVFITPLGFVEDAICLSGLTGTRLKCDVIGVYYPFWWSITSGGPSRSYQYSTAIVELNAATGEVYIEDTQKTVLGSAGHALELKVNSPNAENLKVVLIEEDSDCYAHLKNVIRRRWPSVSVDEAEGAIALNTSNIFLLNMTLDDALEAIKNLKLGNTLYFFDPLRSVEYTTIEKVAGKRMETFFKTGTEFIIFIFTSDWFLGRDDFAPLPCTLEESAWTAQEKKTVSEADALFGNQEWRGYILNKNPIEDKERILIDLYKNRLHRWFRYVLPLPFNPKKGQIFHIMLCSNFETGVRATKDFYVSKTGNPKYSPDNYGAFTRFKRLHPETFIGLSGKTRPLEWRFLWMIITQHEEGICDCMCKDLMNIELDFTKRQFLLEWLADKGYLNPTSIESAWATSIKQYRLNWKTVKEKLGVTQPPLLRPVSPEELMR
jgi:three-Cys-motif partner protein